MTATEFSQETSNFQKHTNSNPVQQHLIDRFHAAVADKIGELDLTSFLDAGCGEGFVSQYLLNQFPTLEITGFDMNPSCVEAASQRNPGATFVEASVTDIPFPDNSFDVVGCFEVLEHLHDPDVALRELLRVSNNTVVVSVPREPYFSLANAARLKNLDVRPRGSDPDHRQFWTRSAFRQFASQYGDVGWIGSSLPWTICVIRPRSI